MLEATGEGTRRTASGRESEGARALESAPRRRAPSGEPAVSRARGFSAPALSAAERPS